MRPSFFAWLLCVGVFSACAAPQVVPQTIRPSQNAQGPKVFILKSSDNPLFEQPIEGFMARFNGEIQVFSNLTKDRLPGISAHISEQKPDLVLCLGNEAAAFAKATIHQTWVLFIAVPSARELHLQDLPNFTGILMEPRTLAAFSQFRMVNPTLHSVLTFYSPQISEDVISLAREDLGSLGIELTAIPTRNFEELKTAFAANIEHVDAVWLPADPVVVNAQAFNYLNQASLQAKKALLTSLTEKFAEQGAMMSASLDLTSLGSQAALLARRTLEHGHGAAKAPEVQSPIGLKLAVNLQTASTLGVSISPDVLPFVNRIYAGHPEATSSAK